MQIFKLVKPGQVDRVIGFDAIPEDLLAGIRRAPANGFPRHWKTFLGIDPKDKNPMPFYTLDFLTVNGDKEKWQAISSYVKRNVLPSFRMLDKIEDMARPLAQDSYSDLTLEPEDVPVIPIPSEEDLEPVATAEEEKPKRIRKKKLEEAAA